MFDANDINGILQLWNKYLSKDTLNNDSNAIKIECHVHIKFVTKMNQYNKRKYSKNCLQNLNIIRSELQKYFKDNSQRLALCPGVLPFFSLPYIYRQCRNAHYIFSFLSTYICI